MASDAHRHGLAFPENADLFYEAVAGRADVDIVFENEHALAFHNPQRDPKLDADVLVIPRAELTSLTHLDLSDATRWQGVWRAICGVDRVLGLGPQEGYRVE